MSATPIVLAAGASRRMGRPKALLDFDGRSCLAVVLAALREGGAAPAIVVVADEDVAAEARAAGSGAVLWNAAPERGQTSSLLMGLRALPRGTRAFFIWPVDHPLVRADVVQALLASPAAPVVVPSHGGRRGHPVLVAVALADELLALPPDGSARDVLRRRRTSYVEAGPEVLADMDTPADYERCLDEYRATRRRASTPGA